MEVVGQGKGKWRKTNKQTNEKMVDVRNPCCLYQWLEGVVGILVIGCLAYSILVRVKIGVRKSKLRYIEDHSH